MDHHVIQPLNARKLIAADLLFNQQVLNLEDVEEDYVLLLPIEEEKEH
tara:strand:+ start:1309 stop:1452 length:144 start_codon:yes stop_codon:yes gene_type:complete